MSGGGGTTVTPSLSFATGSGASNSSAFNVTDNSGSGSKPNNLVIYAIIGLVVIVALWIWRGK